ncbi:MAG: hypothetical protein K5930_02855 [Treponemataceae bacterium]|nr:hypothetical protein [Treponemataceae bacterium]
MMFLRKVGLSVFLLLSAFLLTAQDYNVYYKEKNVPLKLCPDTYFGKQISEEWAGKKGKTANFVAEAYYVLPKKENISIEDISIMTRSFSTMQGIEYYSNSEKKYEVLYPECYTVSDEKGKTKIPDVTYGSADGKKIYILQNDNSFGKSVYEMNYKQKGEEIYFTSVNLDSLKYGIFTAAGPKTLKLTFLVVNGSKEIGFYALVEGDIASFPFIDDFIKDSFVSRLDAVYNWFKKNYEEK